MFKTNQPKETMTKYEVRTFGVKNNYTCVLSVNSIFYQSF